LRSRFDRPPAPPSDYSSDLSGPVIPQRSGSLSAAR